MVRFCRFSCFFYLYGEFQPNLRIMAIIGRNEEQQTILSLYRSSRSEFLVVYGRRRVGKTFLITQTFNDSFAFKHTGLSPYDNSTKITMSDQLTAFHLSLREYGLEEGTPRPRTWMEAFFLLEQLLAKKADGNKMVVFIDELPWMDTPTSKFKAAFEVFYNGWASSRNDILLIVCGSSSSWILTNIVNSKGGLYDRMTCEMKLVPFTLKETEAYLRANNVLLDRYDIVRTYMALGGIPYYLGYLKPGLSVEQNLDKILFDQKGPLRNEFKRLFQTLFKDSEQYEKIVLELSKRNYGYSREEISKNTGISIGGGLTLYLEKLAEADFIEAYSPVGEERKETLYRLKDCFCIFYLKYLWGKSQMDEHFWQNSAGTKGVQIWSGIAFEQICLSHLSNIKRALGISGIVSKASSYIVRGEKGKRGSQIDMIIERADRNVNLCEMKFYSTMVSLDKDDSLQIRNKVEVLRKALKIKGAIFPTLVTTYGLNYNSYSTIFQRCLTLDDLFD